MRQAARASAVGNEMGIPRGGQAVSNELESGGAEHPGRKQSGMGEEPPASGTPGWQAPVAKALRCTNACDPIPERACQLNRIHSANSRSKHPVLRGYAPAVLFASM